MRGPGPDETPLSIDEVLVGVECRVFEGWPVVRRVRPAGTWERSYAGMLAVPSPWEGLL